MANAAKRIFMGQSHGRPDKLMSPAAAQILLSRPKVMPPLDPNFSPFILGQRQYEAATKDCTDEVEFALVRNGEDVARCKVKVFPDDHENIDASVHWVCLQIQVHMWTRGCYKMLIAGPKGTVGNVVAAFSEGGQFHFDAAVMAKTSGLLDSPFEITVVDSAADLPQKKDSPQVCGSVADGCRLAFDLGKSDIKTVAVKDGEVVFSKETEWDVVNPDPDYHYKMVVGAMKETASKLPKVDAIGGSATGVVGANNEATWCDLFPNVPPKVYKEKVVDIFNRIAKDEFDNVPIKVINDGEVTALAGMMMIKEGALYGISMGSANGAGYVDDNGALTGWINEMAYLPCDLNPESIYNPWSPHSGDAAMYMGQRAATKLVALGGVDVPEEMLPWHPNMNVINHAPHAQCLKLIQAAMKDEKKKPQVRKIYETIGVYLGYTIAQYVQHYTIKNVLILGRVSSGEGGQIMLDMAKKVLDVEFPELSHIKFHTPDEHMKRVGQCVAAAALPPLKKQKVA